MVDPLERLKILINSSTPVVVIETVEEARAVRLIRSAADDAHLPVFEWNVADGLTRAEDVQALRDWARTRAVPASIVDVQSANAPSR